MKDKPVFVSFGFFIFIVGNCSDSETWWSVFVRDGEISEICFMWCRLWHCLGATRSLMLLQQVFSFLRRQSCGIAVADNVPLVAGFASYELKGSRGCYKVVRWLLM